GRQIRILRLPEHRPYVLQLLTFDAPLDGLEHLRLDVFGVDDAVRADTAREANREPAAAGAEVGDARAFGDAQGVHDLFGFLPRIAVGPFERAEIFRWEEPAVPGAILRSGAACRHQEHEDEREHACHRFGRALRVRAFVDVRLPPAMPGSVIASGERMASTVLR